MFQNIDSELGQRLIKFAANFFSKYWSEVNEIFYNSTLQTLIVFFTFFVVLSDFIEFKIVTSCGLI